MNGIYHIRQRTSRTQTPDPFIRPWQAGQGQEWVVGIALIPGLPLRILSAELPQNSPRLAISGVLTSFCGSGYLQATSWVIPCVTRRVAQEIRAAGEFKSANESSPAGGLPGDRFARPCRSHFYCSTQTTPLSRGGVPCSVGIMACKRWHPCTLQQEFVAARLGMRTAVHRPGDFKFPLRLGCAERRPLSSFGDAVAFLGEQVRLPAP